MTIFQTETMTRWFWMIHFQKLITYINYTYYPINNTSFIKFCSTATWGHTWFPIYNKSSLSCLYLSYFLRNVHKLCVWGHYMPEMTYLFELRWSNQYCIIQEFGTLPQQIPLNYVYMYSLYKQCNFPEMTHLELGTLPD